VDAELPLRQNSNMRGLKIALAEIPSGYL